MPHMGALAVSLRHTMASLFSPNLNILEYFKMIGNCIIKCRNVCSIGRTGSIATFYMIYSVNLHSLSVNRVIFVGFSLFLSSLPLQNRFLVCLSIKTEKCYFSWLDKKANVPILIGFKVCAQVSFNLCLSIYIKRLPCLLTTFCQKMYLYLGPQKRLMAQ